MGVLYCSYYTKDKVYTKYAKNLIDSLEKYHLPYEVQPINSFDNWDKATHYKPIFLKEMLQKYAGHSVVYVDADAVFCEYPKFFNTLHDEMPEVNIAVHILDHTKYRRKNHPPELLSGTIFLRNSDETSIILQEWILELSKDPKLWDQRALERVLQNHSYYNLPEEYCMIFDYMSSVENPIIKHFQASREAKAAQKKPVKGSRLRIIENNTMIKLGRIHN